MFSRRKDRVQDQSCTSVPEQGLSAIGWQRCKSGIRYRRMYDTRHTYATMCLMSGMNPVFIAAQLGHSVQVLLSTYAKWISSSSDFAELEKLDLPKNGTKLVLDSR